MQSEIIAIYFPQFHKTPENDRWWGEGFTDWDLVKAAQPLFKNHYQPRIPLGNNYYNPCNFETLSKQVAMAKMYGISGFMFYHYWFDGRLILEKPLELFLEHKELDIKFCLSWANGSWTRQWIGNNEILLHQRHVPNRDIWERHFEYLLPYLLDKRYIRIDNKPIITIYSPDLIKETKDMFSLWNDLAKKNGLEGLYFIAVKNHEFPNPNFLAHYDGLMKFQPREANTAAKNPKNQKIVSIRIFRLLPEKIRLLIGDLRRMLIGHKVLSSKNIWDYIIKNAYNNDYKKYDLAIFESAFFEWDNTPRYRKKATIYSGLTFGDKKDYLQELIIKSNQANVPYLFFNAWNEWSEGAYLEPDEKLGFKHLEIISEVLSQDVSRTT